MSVCSIMFFVFLFFFTWNSAPHLDEGLIRREIQEGFHHHRTGIWYQGWWGCCGFFLLWQRRAWYGQGSLQAWGWRHLDRKRGLFWGWWMDGNVNVHGWHWFWCSLIWSVLCIIVSYGFPAFSSPLSGFAVQTCNSQVFSVLRRHVQKRCGSAVLQICKSCIYIATYTQSCFIHIWPRKFTSMGLNASWWKERTVVRLTDRW